jgi:molecular chaperone GrpE
MTPETDDAEQTPDTPPETPPPETPTVEMVQALQEMLEQRDLDLTDTRDRMMRALAETENVRRRLEKEKQDAGTYAMTSFARDLLAVGDNLRRALDAVPEAAKDDDAINGLITGVEMTERELLQVFTRFGITKIDSLGQKLDPHQHQAMAEVENADHAPGHVMQVYQHGYMIKDRLLRPAMVIVAKAPADTAASPRIDTTA